MEKKELQFIYDLITHDSFLTALDYDYANDDEEAFTENRGMSFKQAEKIVEKFRGDVKLAIQLSKK